MTLIRVKAVPIANTYLQTDATPLAIACVPTFVLIEIEGKERTAIRLTIQPFPASAPR
jgi:stage V sporulation protein SpoVS